MTVIFMNSSLIVSHVKGKDKSFIDRRSLPDLRVTRQAILAGNINHERSSNCHYFLPDTWLTSQLQSVIAVVRYQFILLGEQRHICV